MPHPNNDVQIAHFRNLIEARTDARGNPKPGFGKNVAMLKSEIAKLEARAVGGSNALG